MELLPTLIALVAAIVLTPPILRHLEAEGFARENWRGARVAFPAGVAIVAAVLVALIPAVVLDQLFETTSDTGGSTTDVLSAATPPIACFLLGVALLGLIDDGLAGRSRGWRGHGRELLAGRFTTGVLKAVGTLGLALLVLSEGYAVDAGELLLATALLVLTTNLFNLLDLRPGRAAKVFALLALALTLGAWSLDYLELFGLFAAPVLVVGFHDLRERAMLGDTGANLIGGLAGLWMVFQLDVAGQLIALAIVLALTVLGEFRSLTTLIERTPLLRQIDSIGRNGQHA